MGVAKMYGLSADQAYGTGNTGATVVNVTAPSFGQGSKLVLSNGQVIDPFSITAKDIGGTGKSVGFNKSSGSQQGLMDIYLGKQIPTATGGQSAAPAANDSTTPAAPVTTPSQSVTDVVDKMFSQINSYNPNGLLPDGFGAPSYASVYGNPQAGMESGKNLSGNLTNNVMNIYKNNLSDAGDPFLDTFGKKKPGGKTLLGE